MSHDFKVDRFADPHLSRHPARWRRFVCLALPYDDKAQHSRAAVCQLLLPIRSRRYLVPVASHDGVVGLVRHVFHRLVLPAVGFTFSADRICVHPAWRSLQFSFSPLGFSLFRWLRASYGCAGHRVDHVLQRQSVLATHVI